MAAKRALMDAFDSTPYRPTGLAVPDQALANLVESLEWCTTVVSEAASGRHRPHDVAASTGACSPRPPRASETRPACSGAPMPCSRRGPGRAGAISRRRRGSHPGRRAARREDAAVHISFHARLVAAAAVSCATDALIATRRADPDIVAAELSRWQGDVEVRPPRYRRTGLLGSARRLLTGPRQPAVGLVPEQRPGRAGGGRGRGRGRPDQRPARLLGRARDPVGAADQRRFDRCDGVTSPGRDRRRVLHRCRLDHRHRQPHRRAVGRPPHRRAGRVLRAGHVSLRRRPGLFHGNDQRPVQHPRPRGLEGGRHTHRGRRHRCRRERMVGAFFWPRGASKIVGDDLADAFHRGGIYLVQATAWALGMRPALPDAGARPLSGPAAAWTTPSGR